MLKKLNQGGFGIIGIIAVILVMAAMVAAGWFVYDRQKDTKAAKQEAAISQVTDSGSGQAHEGYLGIPELGIELKLADGVKDAVYIVTDDGYTIGLSTQALLNQLGVDCSAQIGSAAVIVSFVNPEDPHATTGTTNIQVFPNAFKSADGVYYAIDYNNQTLCSDPESNLEAVNRLSDQVKTGFKNTTIQALRD